jgi:hypothetical protein
MTYTFKLARRLAVSRDYAMLAVLALVAACTGDVTAPENVASNTFKVIGHGRGRNKTDTTTITVVSQTTDTAAPTLVAVHLTPVSASLVYGATQQFSAYGRNSAGDSIPVSVAFTATGGTVTSSGLYTAGPTGGTFRVVAKESVSGLADSSAVSVTAPATTSTTATGIPYGPFALWDTYTTVKWGPTPFTTSIQSDAPSGVVTRINAARTMGQKLILFMPGGAHTPYLTNGAFDLGKWKAAVDAFNTSTIRQAVAQAVSDGTVIGNDMMDEPEHKSWGGVVTKAMLDQMATYAKQYFPTLPMGINYGHSAAYTWRTGETLKVVDFTISQYSYDVNKGDVTTYRSNVLNRAQLEGWTPAFSLNLLDGGVPDNDGTYDCTGSGQAGTGTYGTNCRMTASDMRTWGQALLPKGCLLLSWKFDGAFMSRSDDQQAFRDVAGQAATLPARSCRRS